MKFKFNERLEGKPLLSRSDNFTAHLVVLKLFFSKVYKLGGININPGKNRSSLLNRHDFKNS